MSDYCPKCGNKKIGYMIKECSNGHRWKKCKKHRNSYQLYSKYNYFHIYKNKIECDDTCIKSD